jgi:hypothetical protein
MAGGDEVSAYFGMRSLLINWVYFRPVGHVIEALRLASSFAVADRDLEISLLLNAESPIELAECVPEVSHVYSAEVRRGIPRELPREWDYVFTDPRAGAPESPDLDRFHDAFRRWVHAKAANQGWDAETIPARVIRPLRLHLPERERRRAAELLPDTSGPRLSVLPAAGSQMRMPSIEFWSALFAEFFERHSDGEIVLLGSFDKSRSFARGITRQDVQALTRRFPRVRDAFDAGLLQQLALAERCRLHISPHSGMSFAVQAVGVPWLALAGQQWYEYLLNGVPLVSVLPDCPLYPCYREMYDDCSKRIRRGVRTPCIEDAALMGKLPEIVSSMEALLAGAIDYRDAARAHEAALARLLGPESIVDWPEVIADGYVF